MENVDNWCFYGGASGTTLSSSEEYGGGAERGGGVDIACIMCGKPWGLSTAGGGQKNGVENYAGYQLFFHSHKS